MGRPVTDATDSAAPPRASPSSLESTTPVKSTPVLERLRGRDRILADHGVEDEQHLVGIDALRMSPACFMSSASTPRRPAVSTMTTSYCLSSRELDRVLGDLDRVALRLGEQPPLLLADVPGSGA